MSDHSESKSTRTPNPGRPDKELLGWLFRTVAVLLVFICAGFTSASAFLLWGASLYWRVDEEPGFLIRLMVKGAMFGLLALFCAVDLRRSAASWPRPDSGGHPATAPDVRRQSFALAGALLLVALLMFPFLRTYPHIEPDEAHHLIVARNLAAYGVYGSGRPDTGFEWFDDYDSVGPPVILPVAAAFRAAGVSLKVGRAVMAVFFMVLCLLVVAFVRPLFGELAAIISTVILAMAVGSVYLGRTLYGEAPALAFLIAGLIFWRTSIRGNATVFTGLAAGVCFGLSILSKNFMILSAWAFLGAFIYDRMTYRTLRIVHILCPAIAVSVLVLAWVAIQNAHQTTGSGIASGQLSMYRHNLMFGFQSVPVTLGWILRRPLGLIVSFVAMTTAVPVVFLRRYSPSAVVLFLFAPFVAYWWVFFTTGNIPRYLWYAIAIAAVFTGPLVWMFLRGTRTAPREAARYACTLLTFVLLLPSAVNTYAELRGIYLRNDTADELALAEYARTLPAGARIATTFYPVERNLNFLAGRAVTRIPAEPEALYGHAMIIVDSVSQKVLLKGRQPAERFGRYIVLREP